MQEKSAAIVLRTVRYNDNSLIVDLLTESSGRVSYIIKVSRARNTSVHPSLFSPLALLEIEAEGKSVSRLSRITESRLLYPAHSLSSNPIKVSIALFLGEFLCYAMREECNNPSLFAYLSYSVRWLDAVSDDRVANFHLVFLMRFSRFLGLFPNLDNYNEGDCFDMLNACFSSVVPPHGQYLKPAESVSLLSLMRMNYETMHLFSFNRTQRIRCLEVLNDYYRLHIPGVPQLRSLEVLQQIFD